MRRFSVKIFFLLFEVRLNKRVTPASLINWCFMAGSKLLGGFLAPHSDTRVVWAIRTLIVQFVKLCLIEHILVEVLCVRLARCRLRSVRQASHVFTTLLKSAIVLINVHIVIDLDPSGVVSLRVALLSLALLLSLLLDLSAEDLLKLLQLETFVGRLPNTLDENAALVSRLPILCLLLVVDADVAKLVHVRGDRGRGEDVQVPVLKHLDLLILLELEVIQMVVININLVAQINRLALLYLDKGVSAHEVGASVSAWIRESEVAIVDIVFGLVQSD